MNPELAYLLGRTSGKWRNFTLHKSQKKLLDLFFKYTSIFKDIKLKKYKDKWEITYNLHEINVDEKFDSHFIRGMYESSPNGNDDCVRVICTAMKKSELEAKTGARGYFVNGIVLFEKHNALDFLEFVYRDTTEIYSRFCYSKFIRLSNGFEKKRLDIKTFHYRLLSDNAIDPFKARASDSGYDLTLVKLIKQVNNTFWYSTSVSVEPPSGFYFDLVPRSSLCKSGYILANSVGVIDRSYTGDIIVVLDKFDSSLPNIELPYRAVQIIPRRILHMKPIEVVDEKCDETLSSSIRGNKGFGSSGL